jgi:4-hydroxy-tetrahydrodipicolinate synthase
MKNLPIVWTAIVTPLDHNGNIDFTSFRKLVAEQEKAGNGILFLGSTGEALNLSSQEKQQILDWFKSNKPSVPTMCGVGGSDLEATLTWVETINQYSFDAYLMVTPPYAKPGDEGQKAWFTELLNKAKKPCVLYNVPGRTACTLSRRALESLKNHPNFLGIKESSGSLEEFKKFKSVLPNHAVYCGDDLLMPEFSDSGACGLISVASNVWPSATNAYAKKCLEKTFKDHQLWKDASNSLFTASNPVPVKYLLHKNGWIASTKVKLPLSDADFKDSKSILDANQKISQWI